MQIYIPSQLKKEAKQMVKTGKFSSLNELIQTGIRIVLRTQKKLTVNGFTPEFEGQVLDAEKEPLEKDVVLQSEQDISRFIRNLKTK